MNNDLSFWRKLSLVNGGSPKTDNEIRYLYRDLVRPNIPVNALWDAERGVNMRGPYVDPEMYSMRDLRKMAIKNRGLGINQTDKDIPEISPTGKIMKQLLGPDVLVVPEYKDMQNLWER